MDTNKPSIGGLLKPLNQKEKVSNVADNYLQYYTDNNNDNKTDLNVLRSDNSKQIAEQYYDLATDFFEYGWGDAFHFVNLYNGDSREHAFKKYHYKLALKLKLSAGDKVLDLGCGVGGPARDIAHFSDAHVTGLNINEYQLKRCEEITAKNNMQHLCDYVKGDFCNIPFESESFDAVYSIEATCHAGVLQEVYSEAFRVLKPGGIYACVEWIMTDKYNPQDARHKRIKEDIMEGDGLPDIRDTETALKTFRAVGFEIMDATDLATQSPVPWYSLLMPRWTLADFKSTPTGRWLTHLLLLGMEFTGLAPKGSAKVHRTLCKGADAIVKGGKEEIFSPMLLIIGRKPHKQI